MPRDRYLWHPHERLVLTHHRARRRPDHDELILHMTIGAPGQPPSGPMPPSWRRAFSPPIETRSPMPDFKTAVAVTAEVIIGEGPLPVRLAASRKGRPLSRPVPLAVQGVTFAPEGLFTAELQADGATIHFLDTGAEGSCTATITAQATLGTRVVTLSADLALTAVAGDPDALDLTVDPQVAPAPAPAMATGGFTRAAG